LETRRKVLKLSWLYIIANNLAVFVEAPNLLCSLLPYSTQVHELSLVTFYGYTSQYLYSYFPDTIKLWNSIAHGVVSCNSSMLCTYILLDYWCVLVTI